MAFILLPKYETTGEGLVAETRDGLNTLRKTAVFIVAIHIDML